MNPKLRFSLALLLLSLLISPACSKGGPEKSTQLTTKDPTTLNLKLKRGMKILLAHRQLNPAMEIYGKPGVRILTLEEPGSAEGLVFSWINPPDSRADKTPESQPDPDGPAAQALQAQVFDLDAVQNGKMSLPNLAQARHMTLPLFWPSGDLFLSDSSGIWLSDAAFEELRQNQSTSWDPGLVGNPLLGPAEGIGSVEAGLKALEKLTSKPEAEAENDQALPTIQVSGVEKYPLTIDGKNQEVEVLSASNALAAYKILNNAQNPMILQLTVAPQATPLQTLTTPLGILQGLADYRVLEIQSPEFQAKNREPGTVKEM